MDAILVFNINNNICSNVLESQIHAANRWGCKYIIEHKPNDLFKDCYPSWNKISALYDKEFYYNFDRILILDSDILINIKAPNPFDLCNYNAFNVVRDSHYKYINDKETLNKHIKDYITPHYRYFEIRSHDISFSYIKNFFNSGVMMYSPAKLLSRDINNPKYTNIILDSILDGTSHREQAIINYIIQAEIDINYLDKTWNIIDPNISKPMRGYMYHFTGKDWSGLKEKVKTYNWKLL